MLHQRRKRADATLMEAIDSALDELGHETLDEPLAAAADDAGDHPDPVTLSEPEFDDGGLLRWGSLPSPQP